MVTLHKFVQDTIESMKDFDPNNRDCLKKVIRIAIDDFKFSSQEKVEELNGQEVLYIASVVEENLLSKIATLANEEEVSVEAVYEGHVVRKY
ncbi:hypothetical protein H1D32_03380 [Anaerobacillus sp. CMMVII]|uniref:DUF6407 family protein n=1 Tax=Anaerobacillus sp. CMMVII TaxID=2755588 RepID=UPI0021B84771|nr:DUF6407 family protein [Anaerobacillus sp. CMMVII]MCT8136879.1 hypothetical protein [Anaerobacillus sp. CMMVII]